MRALAGASLVARRVGGGDEGPVGVVDRYVSGLNLYVGRIDAEEGLSRANGVSCTGELRGQNRELRAETDRAARDVGGARSVSPGWVSQGPGGGDEDGLEVTGVVTLTLEGVPDRDGRRRHGWYTRRTWTFELEKSLRIGWTICGVQRDGSF